MQHNTKTLSLSFLFAFVLVFIGGALSGEPLWARPAGKAAKASKASKTKAAKASKAAKATKATKASKTKATKTKAAKERTARAHKVRTTTKVSHMSKLAARRIAARRAAEARRQAIIAHNRAVDTRLLDITQDKIEGDNLAGEDMQIRSLALEALGRNPGTVVVMEANTGRVLSMVNQAWAIGKPFKPCSTIKLLTSLAALNEGLVDPDAPLPIGHGYSISMTEALARSNNEYFQELGGLIGYDRFMKYARMVGFGEPTGVNLPGESAGSIPTRDEDFRRMFSHGDGYGITALQLASFTAALANGGTIYKPQVLRTAEEVKKFTPVVHHTFQLAETDRAKILEGMLDAVSYGTARRSNAAVLSVAGKTGSCNCECSAGTKLGLFTSFMSPSNPNLVVTVITTGSAQRGSLASIVAGNIYNGLNGTYAGNEQNRPRRAEPMRVVRDEKGSILLTNRNK
ncbi:MAG: hypothetical protein K1Y36_28095 [Blastocatellia bacterium]|nr:hypothetical protein [Blastocatellia bacterium]